MTWREFFSRLVWGERARPTLGDQGWARSEHGAVCRRRSLDGRLDELTRTRLAHTAALDDNMCAVLWEQERTGLPGGIVPRRTS